VVPDLTNGQVPNLNLESILKRYRKAEQRAYQAACIKDTVAFLNKGSDVVIALPTGAGKTLVYAPIAAETSEVGKSALVLTATKQAQRRVDSEMRKFKTRSDPVLVFGVQEYDCPVLKAKAQNWCCGELKEEHCKPQNLNCDVIKSEKDYASSSLVITNFSKFLLASTDRNYDVIVLDDSHSFENTKEQAYQITVHFGPVRRFYQNGIHDAPLNTMIEGFLNLYAEIFERCVNPEDKEGMITPEYIMRLAKLIADKDGGQPQKEIMNLPALERSICWNIYYFAKRCSESSKYQFYIRKDYYDAEDIDSSELISRRDDILEYVIRNRFKGSRVVFVTATPGDTTLHANSCTLRNYTNSVLGVVPTENSDFPEIANWFQKLRILIVEDIGDTRQMNPFEKAINLTTSILESQKERALVLFKNYRDQNTAYNILRKKFPEEKLFFIDVSLQDSDVIEELASKKKISLASASSTLWEGINIEKLRLAIVVSLPFIRPPVGQKLSYPHLERRMLIRLQQGIGRIIRDPDDFGVAVLTDVRSKKYVNRQIFSPKLRIDALFNTWSAT
jgi:hypothetical protein